MPHQPEQPRQNFKPVVTPWRCKNCKDQIGHGHVITLDGVDHLMIGKAKVFRLEAVCGCGTPNYWNQRQKDMVEETEAFLELLVSAKTSTP